MTLRTPRRRISPRTKLRYRAIRQFFRRAIGSTSEQDIKINSSINVNVTDLKRKIVGLEEQLDQVSKHCREIVYLDNCSRRTSESVFQSDPKQEVDLINELNEVSSDKKSNDIDTQLLYKSECGYKKSDDSVFRPTSNNDKRISENQIMPSDNDGHITKTKKRNRLRKVSSTDPGFHKQRTRSVYDDIATTAYSTSSFRSLANPHTLNNNYPTHAHDKYNLKEEYIQDVIPNYHKDRKYKDSMKKSVDNYKQHYEDKPVRVRKTKRLGRELDQDFIADIIRRQYKPVKLFGPKESDVSQFSAPICRDQDLSTQENMLDDSALCSYLYGGGPHKRSKHHRHDLSTMRSVCDTHLYSSKNQFRQKHRRTHADDYCNSEMYDLVPVKERSSPKTRRKFVEEAMTSYDQYKEVPPSPKTHRPRLNLKAQYYTDLNEDYLTTKQLRRRSPTRPKRFQEQCESDVNSDVILDKNVVKLRKSRKHMKVVAEESQLQNQNQDDNVMSNVQYPQYVNEHTSMTIDTSLNKTQETDINVAKTDKALCEIKDILQSFLHEIKKETIASQCDKSDFTCKSQEDSNGIHDSSKLNNNMIPNNFNNLNVGQCGMAPYPAPFHNPCCYPIVPLCPLNCPVTVPGGYIMPSQSFTCTNCANIPKESTSSHCCNKNSDPTCRTETEELIKEIYKFVAQGPVRKQDSEVKDKRLENNVGNDKILTSRSVGGSYGNFQHDAKVGTQPLKCYSKSCEAIGPRLIIDPYYNNQTSQSYSDTLLEKLSLEVTQSTSDTEVDITDLSSEYKAKRNRLAKVLGLFKKKKKDVIEELSESESVTEGNVSHSPEQSPPFRQEITNYMMYGQDHYCNSPVETLYPKPHEAGAYSYETDLYNYQPRAYEYQSRTHEYQSSSQGYQSPSPGYQSPTPGYQSPSQGYQSPPHGYQLPPQGCQSPRNAYQREYQPRLHEYQPEYHPPYNPSLRGYQSPPPDPYTQRTQPHMRDALSPVPQPPRHRPTAPPINSSYDSSFSGTQPPLCLKEIEVKSTATQSERKISLFRRFKKKMHKPVKVAPVATADQYHRSFSTQTPQVSKKPMIKPFFNWKKLQSKAMQGLDSNEAVAYTLKAQKELADGDLKLRKAMVKKLFHKRNPFSPRNLIMKTLLGKDKPNLNETKHVFRPRMFL